jgi:hypothetical protein
MKSLIFAAAVVAISHATSEMQSATITVTGANNPHQWTIPGDSTKDHINGTKVGDPGNRMQIPVANGDIVSFVVASGSHHVLFENAQSEQTNGVWEIVKGSGTLENLPDGKLKNFNHDEARCSVAATGNLIQIRILRLDQGKSILFGCNPHSDTATNIEMVGVIVPR